MSEVLNNIIELADGSQFDGKAGPVNSSLIISRITKAMAQTHLLDFGDPEKMKKITFYFGAFKQEFTGYTRFGHIELAEDGTYSVWMHADGEHTAERIPTVPEEYLPKGL